MPRSVVTRWFAPLLLAALGLAPFLAAWPVRAAPPAQLPGTAPLTLEGDIAAHLVDGVDRFLLQKIDASTAGRAKYWQRDFSSHAAYRQSIEPNRKRLAQMLGVRDERLKFDAPELLATTKQSALVAQTKSYRVFAVRWPVLGYPGPGREGEVSVHGEGLLLLPAGVLPTADIIAIPDADQTPEQIAGLTPGLEAERQFARRLAEAGCRVLVPALISRAYKARNGRAKMTDREYLYRSGFELGRHLIGYETQKVLAGVDWFAREAAEDQREAQIGVIGHGEGGLLALVSAALDARIDAACVRGYFDDRNAVWQQPIDRNIFGLLREFGDAELAAMCIGRNLILADTPGPELTLPSEGGAPAVLASPRHSQQEWERLLKLVDRTELSLGINRVASDGLEEFFGRLSDKPLGEPLALDIVQPLRDAAPRTVRQFAEIDRHNQALLAECAYVRKARFWDKLDTSSVAAFEKSIAPYREEFQRDVIGSFNEPLLPPRPRTRLAYDQEKWIGYEVVLDVWPDVIAYGILCLPRDLKAGEKRPVVVCQHGLEGRPQDIVTGDHPAYHDFASKLAERGFITFAPQNLYIGKDRFRTLQRKANPLGCTLFSIIVPQHQQIVDWLQTLPQVDPQRIAFYGLSYGGKSAMRIPPLVPDYCLSICSADFNEWVWKNASTRSPYSYVWTNEYEIFEWDLGHTFNYAEMAALIAPRPFMVERGHFDGVAPDEAVGYEFAKVRHLYAARLKLPPPACQIEWFAGPHTINGQETFRFLHRHLNWPEQ